MQTTIQQCHLSHSHANARLSWFTIQARALTSAGTPCCASTYLWCSQDRVPASFQPPWPLQSTEVAETYFERFAFVVGWLGSSVLFSFLLGK